MERTLEVKAADGYPLATTVFGDGTERPLVLINAATGVTQPYYRRFAQWLSKRGHQVVTWDYRGLGRSRPKSLRGFHASMRDFGQLDFEGVLRWAEQEARGRPIAVVGHSLGGQVLGMAESNQLVSRAVTVVTCAGTWWLYPPEHRRRMALLWHAMPLLARPLGYLPGRLGVGADLPRGVAEEWARWGRLPNYCFDDGISRAGFNRLTIPIRSYSFTDDAYAPKTAVDWFHAQFAAAKVERRHVAPAQLGLDEIGHFGFFRPFARDTLWAEVAEALR
jgi:predicted alpha/beta hydrolase